MACSGSEVVGNLLKESNIFCKRVGWEEDCCYGVFEFVAHSLFQHAAFCCLVVAKPAYYACELRKVPGKLSHSWSELGRFVAGGAVRVVVAKAFFSDRNKFDHFLNIEDFCVLVGVGHDDVRGPATNLLTAESILASWFKNQ